MQVFFHRSAHWVVAPAHCSPRCRFTIHDLLLLVAKRFILGVTGWEALGVEIAQAFIWSCLALSVVLADVAIHWKEIRSALTVPVRSGVSRKGVSPKDSLPKNAVGAT